MTINSQLLTIEPKTKQKQTKQTTRTGTESQWGGGGGRMEEKVQGIRIINVPGWCSSVD